MHVSNQKQNNCRCQSLSDTSVQAQELQRLWKAYEERPPYFDKKKYMQRPQGLSQRHKYRPKT